MKSSKKLILPDPTSFYVDLDRQLTLSGVEGERIAVMRSVSLEKPKHRYLYRAFGRAFERVGWKLVLVDEESKNLRNLPDGTLEFHDGKAGVGRVMSSLLMIRLDCLIGRNLRLYLLRKNPGRSE